MGAARIAPLALLGPARRVPAARVVAVASRDPRRARAFARKHQIPQVHQSYDALLGDPEIDAVYNPLPNALHCPWTVRALRAGKHVLCEKPIASNAEEAGHMARVAAQTGRVLMEAMHYRYHPLAMRMKQIVESGELGAIRHIEAHLCVPLLLPGDIRYRFDLAGGATMDVGCYPIHLIRFLAGAEPEVTGAKAGLMSAQVDRWMTAELRFGDGCTGRTVCSLLSAVPLRTRAVVKGSEGELRVTSPFHPHFYHRVRVRSRQGARSERAPGETTYTYQLRAFVDAVRGGGSAPADPTDAVANMRVIDAVYEKAGLRRRGT